jgi:4-amino-4-deoxy-L-arabinose transferase-like glycosyltransferase
MKTAEKTGPAAAQQGGRFTRSDALFVAGACLAAAAIRILVAWASGPAAPQEIRYITVALGLFDGSAFEMTGTRFPAIIQPPFYPALVALASWLIPDPLVAARGISILAGSLIVLPVAALTSRVLGRRAATRAAWLIAVHPLLCHISGISMTEPTFGLLVACAGYVFLRAGEGKSGFHLPLGGGLLLGLAFLTRPEGLAYLGTGSLLLFWSLWRSHRRSLTTAVVAFSLVAAGFLALTIPYGVWLKEKTGRWMLAPKAVMSQAHNSIMTLGVEEGWTEPYGTTLFYERVKFGLNEDRTDLRSSVALRGLGLLPNSEGFEANQIDVTDVVNSSHLVKVVTRNLYQLYVETLKYGLVMPSFLIALLGLGITAQPWSRGARRRGNLLLLIWLLSGGSWLVSYVQPRFLYPSILFLTPWIAAGWTRVEDWIRSSFFPGNPGPESIPGRALTGLMALVVAIGSLIHAIPPTQELGSTWHEHAEAGRRMREMGIESGTVMALTPAVAFYSGLKFEVMPYSSLADMLQYARYKSADYLVASMAEFPTYRPQFMALFEDPAAREGLKPVLTIDDNPRRSVIVFKVPGRKTVNEPEVPSSPKQAGNPGT